MVKAYQFLKKYGVALGFSVGGVLSVLSLLVIVMGLGKEATNAELYESSAFDFGLFVTYFLTLASTLAALAFPVLYLIQNFKESTKLLISLGLLVVIFFVSYLMASDAVTPDIAKAYATMKMTPGNVKFTETILYLGYILFFASLGAVVFGFVRPLIARK